MHRATDRGRVAASMTAIQPVTIAFSNRKRSLGFVIAALFFVYCVWKLANDTKADQFDLFMTWSGLVVFGLLCIALIGNILLGSKTALTLTKTGLTYPTYSSDEIPWSVVADIRSIKSHGVRYVFLELSPLASTKIRRHLMNRILNWGETWLAPLGIYLSSNHLDVSEDRLFSTLRGLWLAAGAAPTPIRPPVQDVSRRVTCQSLPTKTHLSSVRASPAANKRRASNLPTIPDQNPT